MVQYWYTNGRPSWVQWANGPADLSALWTRTSNYLQFNWHGDAAVWVATDGNANNNGWTTNDPFGIYTASTPKDYYYWNGGWGYLYFSKLNLYYAHGRWYNPVNALWLSPNEKGDYLYGGDDPGQNAVNWGLAPQGAPTPQPSTRLTLEDLKELATMEAVLKFLGAESPSKLVASRVAAYAAVGEMGNYCGPNRIFFATKPDPNKLNAALLQCRQVFGAVAATVQNRLKCINQEAGYEKCDEKWAVYGGRSGTVTYSRILLGGCQGIRCTQYQGFHHWMDPAEKYRLGFDSPNLTTRQLSRIKYSLAFFAALSVFKDDPTYGTGLIGKRTNWTDFRLLYPTLKAAQDARDAFCKTAKCADTSSFAPTVAFYGGPSE